MYHLYYNINILITIADKIRFTVCESIKINTSVEVLTNTATVTLPRNFKNGIDSGGKSINISNKSILDFISIGDKINIEFGYNGFYKTEFIGYITEINADIPLVLECQDEMYQLKNAPKIKKYFKTGSLKEILKTILPPKYNFELNEKINYGNWLVDNNTPYEVLEELREKTGLRANFKDEKTLSIGQVVDLKPTKIHKFNFSENVRRSSSIKFDTNKSIDLLVTVTSMQKNGKKLEYITGKKGGNSTTVKLPSGLNLRDLKLWGDDIYNAKTKEGLKGNLDSWCYPRTKAGDLAEIHRPIFDDLHQDGTYFIESVTIDVNATDGIKRSNQLGHKIIQQGNQVVTLTSN